MDKYTWVDFGDSYLPSELNAAYLWAQLESADVIHNDRMKTWEHYYNLLKPYYELNKEHPIVNKKIIELKQKEKFRKSFMEGNEDVMSFVENIKKNYDTSVFNTIINDFICEGKAELHDYISMPQRYLEYKDYEKTMKLINLVL